MIRVSDMPRVQIPSIKIPRAAPAVLAAILVLAGFYALKPQDGPLTQLEVRGEFAHLQPEDVRQAAEPYLASSFFTVDVAQLREALAALPWVARVRAEREWPGAISVRVWERQPYARWNEAAMLDLESHPFTPRAAEIPTGLPRLSGNPGHELEVAQTWQRLAPALLGSPFELLGLKLDARGEWSAHTTGDIELRFGQDAPDSRIATLNGVARRVLEGRWEQVQYLDLRYTNGFAVGWREAEATGGKK